jgi:hypothetical protein
MESSCKALGIVSAVAKRVMPLPDEIGDIDEGPTMNGGSSGLYEFMHHGAII